MADTVIGQQQNLGVTSHNFRYIVTLPGAFKSVQLLTALFYFISYATITCLRGKKIKLIVIMCIPAIGFFITLGILIMSMVQLAERSKALSRTKKELKICTILGVYYSIATIVAILSDSMKPDYGNSECGTRKSGYRARCGSVDNYMGKGERVDRTAFNCALCFSFLAAMAYAVDASLRWKTGKREENPQTNLLELTSY